MAAIASVGGSSPGPVGGVPTPVLLALVGGGIGAIVLLRRKMGSSGSGTSTDQATLLPNTAIMLGSLQQGILDLKGQVGTGQADLSTQLTGTQENIGAQIDALTSQEQQGLTDLQTNLTGSINTEVGNLSDNLSKLLAGQDQLSTLIGQNANAQKAYDTAFSDSVQKGFDNLVATHNAELAGLSTLGSNLTTLEGQITQVGGAVGSIQGQLGSIGQAATATPSIDWSVLNGKRFYLPNGGGYQVNNGKVYAYQNQKAFDNSQAQYIGWLNVNPAIISGSPDYAGAIA